MIEKNITGIILAGGKSSRMGTDKGMILLNGKKFIEHIINALSPNVNQIIIIANNDNYNELGYKVYKDLIEDSGPLGGIYTGLKLSTTEKNIVLSCDTPFITTEFIKFIISNSNDSEITVPVFKNNTEPLCAVYSKNITQNIYDLIVNNELKMQNVLKKFKTKELQINSNHTMFSENLFQNINTPQELNSQNNINL